jgi:hypothetical protein
VNYATRLDAGSVNALYTKKALLFLRLAVLQLLVVAAMDLTSSLGWLETYLAAALVIPSSNLLLFSCAAAALLLAILFVKWAGAAHRARVLAFENERLQVDLVIARTSMEYERKRRLASTSAGTEVVASPIERRPPRELQELLAKEHFHGK